MTFDCPCTKAEAMFALAHAAVLDADGNRVIVHSMLGAVGADWDLVRALELVETAESVAWKSHDLSHELEVVAVSAGRRSRYAFDVKMPNVGDERAS